MKNVLTILIAVLLSVLAASLVRHENKPEAEKVESVYDRVMRTGTIRCGYVVRAPLFVVDPNTQEMSGIMYDVTNELAKRLSLKIEWTEETTLADFVMGVKNRRFDTVCGGIWINSNRAREIDFSETFFYETASAYARVGDDRFTDRDALNRSEINLAAMEGTVSAYLAAQYFPKAGRHRLPENSPYEQVILDVAASKADAAVFADTGARLYQVNNPDKVKRLDGIGILGLYAVTYPVARGESDFRRMLDNAVKDMLNQGVVTVILDKYPDYDDVIKRVRSGYDD